MRTLALRLGLAGAFTASAVAAWGCSACGGPSPFALAGLVGYGALLVAALRRPYGAIVRWGLAAAAGVHAALVTAMFRTDTVCATCVMAAASAAIALLAAMGRDGAWWGSVLATAPWTAALVLVMLPAPPPVEPDGPLRLEIYSRPDCPFCQELRDRVLPEAIRGMAPAIAWKDASEAAFVRLVPTVRITRGGRSRILEGLPTPERLRSELDAISGGHP